MLNGYKVFSWDDENVLELDRGMIVQHYKQFRYS